MVYRVAEVNPVFVKWLPLVGMIATVNLICYVTDRAVLERRWTASDLFWLTCWSSLSPFVALLFVAAGFDAIYDKELIGVLWFIPAAISAFAGAVLLRLAQGMKLRRVRSGELFRRALVLSKTMGVPLERVYVVPAGRGQLTNAFSLSHSIAVTDNYGNFLDERELDFVIGHELAHAKERHGQKNLQIAGVIYVIALVVCVFLPPALLWLRPVFDVCIVLAPIMTYYALSRRLEYSADAASIRLTRDPEAGIRALANLDRLTQTPASSDWFSELFLTHPDFTGRVRAIADVGRMPAERFASVIREIRQRDVSF